MHSRSPAESTDGVSDVATVHHPRVSRSPPMDSVGPWRGIRPGAPLDVRLCPGEVSAHPSAASGHSAVRDQRRFRGGQPAAFHQYKQIVGRSSRRDGEPEGGLSLPVETRVPVDDLLAGHPRALIETGCPCVDADQSTAGDIPG
jgi:hypothetical protein